MATFISEYVKALVGLSLTSVMFPLVKSLLNDKIPASANIAESKIVRLIFS